ncbi:hypothetical protein KN1_12100 [Stygiolobus caldivivus]|uniref:Uncharacterized protein n=1 Tax=Stygiolobus caldivivus TaxID=2824673 RepID=A0A8D5ZEW5_9CREN|nr:hypothetical protein KN1_12100 [Stygiolobus caldivivus]
MVVKIDNLPAELLCPYEAARNNENIISLGMVIYEKYGKD